MAVASLVLGIVSVVVNFLGLFWVSLVTSIIGLILGIMARKKAPSGMATAGFVLSIIGLVLSGIIIVACVGSIGIITNLGSDLINNSLN